MTLPLNKTKLVCTIGPATNTPEMMARMLDAGMNVARLNFSHGDFTQHKAVIDNLRAAAQATGHRLAIMADLPGPKMRIGQLAQDNLTIKRGDSFTLTTRDIVGDQTGASVTFQQLPSVVKPGDVLFLNDGVVQIEVQEVQATDVRCTVLVGGELRSRNGLNLPGINLGICAFTDHDRACMQFALQNGVDAISQSFVERAADIEAVREAAAQMGYSPFIIAKFERSGALDHIDEILEAADGIMIARGDLGVEIPIERIAVVQKQLMRKANEMGKPVITATQMLESMVAHSRPTRAEATDVANAILDGTDCVMLSEEAAIGKFPVEAATMLARIAAEVEPHRAAFRPTPPSDCAPTQPLRLVDLVSQNVRYTVDRAKPVVVLVPTTSGHTARMVTRYRLPIWVAAICRDHCTCQGLQFSYGVHPVQVQDEPSDWNGFAREWVEAHGLEAGLAVLTEGPSKQNPNGNNRLVLIDMNPGRVADLNE